MTKTQFHKILFLVLFWLGAVTFYIFMELSMEKFLADYFQIEKFEYNFWRIYLIAFSMTLLVGIVTASFEVLYFGKRLQKKPFGAILIIKSLFYLSVIFIITSLGSILNFSLSVQESIFHPEVFQMFLYYLSGPKIWAVMIYWSLAIMLALLILQISEKLGQGVLVNYILGRYHKPKEDTRIFMFLDLTSSSTYAEKLGHIRYSKLIQDCFYDLTNLVNKYEVQIYQYVGDEVVLTWEKEKGIENNNCIKTFFAFDKNLKSKSKYYQNEYGVIPEFKAGANFGYVTIAEVGEMKKELAYHGDAINTAAHIRSECGKHKKKLLISADLLSLLPDIDEEFEINSVGVCELKGKQNIIGIFSVEEKINEEIRNDPKN